MPVLLVRHAHALSRSEWEGDDDSRILSVRGSRQAQMLVPALLELKPARIVSSPAVRCVDTVAPLAAAAGLEVEIDARLAEGSGTAAVELFGDGNGRTVVLCSHGDVIPEVLGLIAARDLLDLGPVPKVEKGSVWVLEDRPARFGPARYIPPPKPRD